METVSDFYKHALFLKRITIVEAGSVTTGYNKPKCFLPRRHENTNNRPNHNRKGTLSKKRRYSQHIVLCNVKKYDRGWAAKL